MDMPKLHIGIWELGDRRLTASKDETHNHILKYVHGNPLISQYNILPTSIKQSQDWEALLGWRQPSQLSQALSRPTLNHDILTTIFTQLIDSPSTSQRSFSSLFRAEPYHGNNSLDTLRTCILVSKAWYAAAIKLLSYTAVIELEHLGEELTKWKGWDSGPDATGAEDASSSTEDTERKPTGGTRRKEWVRRLVLVGGGMASIFSPNTSTYPLRNLWNVFPYVQHVEIFGLGWGTEGLLGFGQAGRGPFPSPTNTLPFSRIQSLQITAMSEHLLRGVTPGQNFLDGAKFWSCLPSLNRLSLRGMTYRISPNSLVIPGNPDPSLAVTSQNSLRHQKNGPCTPYKTPSYSLRELVLERCTLSLATLRWLVGSRSFATLAALEIESCTFWDDEDPEGIWSGDDEDPSTQSQEAFDDMLARLSLNLSVHISKKP